MRNPMARFTSSNLWPSMLPLTSSTITRSSGASVEDDSAAADALACMSTTNPSLAATLASAGYSPGSAELVSAARALSGDPLCKALVAELRELSQRVSDEREYREGPRVLPCRHEVAGAA